MADDVPAILQEIMDLSGDKQAALAKKIGVAQSTVNRWLNGESVPNIVDWGRAKEIWRKLKGIKLTLDEKAARYGPATETVIHGMVDDYLSRLPPPKK